MALTREEVLCCTLDLAKKLGTQVLTEQQYYKGMGECAADHLLHFRSLKECLIAAGLKCGDPGAWTDEELLCALLKAIMKRGCVRGKAHQFQEHLPFDVSILVRRFKCWKWALYEAREYALRYFPQFPLLKHMPSRWAVEPQAVQPLPPPLDPKSFGPLLQFRQMEHEPTCEQGVVVLFGMLCGELGFQIEALRAQFPDCEAKRCIDVKNRRYKRVRIEFEYLSRNFETHRHHPAGCDLIVCWRDNWPDAPVEVLALDQVVRGIQARERLNAA